MSRRYRHRGGVGTGAGGPGGSYPGSRRESERRGDWWWHSCRAGRERGPRCQGVRRGLAARFVRSLRELFVVVLAMAAVMAAAVMVVVVMAMSLNRIGSAGARAAACAQATRPRGPSGHVRRGGRKGSGGQHVRRPKCAGSTRGSHGSDCRGVCDKL